MSKKYRVMSFERALEETVPTRLHAALWIKTGHSQNQITPLGVKTGQYRFILENLASAIGAKLFWRGHVMFLLKETIRR
jgi:hypothetical protein